MNEDEPELPPLPASTRPIARLARKRTIDEVLYNASSDPPMFSSDDASSTVENYTYQRPKRLHGGTWWANQDHPVSIAHRNLNGKRAFKRNFDSGIWMGSDSSLSENDMQMQDLSAAERQWPERQRSKILRVKDLLVFSQEQNVELSERQQAAAELVEQAVIETNPTIDLSRMSLESLPWTILKPLAAFTPEPTQEYEPFLSSLSIYLAQNRLTKIPPELFNLEGLAHLSLRHNKLREISPSIARLAPCLRELNLSVNRLNYLPVEILELIQDHSRPSLLRLSDNPFFQPIRRPKLHNDQKNEPDQTTVIPSERTSNTDIPPHAIPRCDSKTICTSRIAFVDFRGHSVNGPVPSRDQVADPLPAQSSTDLLRTKSKVPSLYELALRASTAYPIEQILHCLGEDVPRTLVSNLKTASEQAKTGFQACSICHRKFSVARTEWVEWRGTVQAYRDVPLLYRGCSWSCVPDVNHLSAEAKDCGWTAGEALAEALTET